MPAYSYKERFVPWILNGSKRQTVRGRRTKGFCKPGDTVYNYFGLRTQWCKKLNEFPCKAVKSIFIAPNCSGRLKFILFERRLTDQEFFKEEGIITFANELDCNYHSMTPGEQAVFAWNDGFRSGNDPEDPANFELMERFWKQTHELPFLGDVIYW